MKKFLNKFLNWVFWWRRSRLPERSTKVLPTKRNSKNVEKALRQIGRDMTKQSRKFNRNMKKGQHRNK